MVLERLIHLLFRIEDLSTRVFSDIVPNLPVNILLGSLFIDHFIRELFPAERKFVPWDSPPVAMLMRNQQ